ncbi:MAG: prephenate dehydrogenase/arogenate dehydrogenase family protein [Planctomycetia bacterium]|nr:prephenate dehydrogenase/arogenate dehydrogenase family protein [Planctomycetia bacterium]
MIIGVVGLGLIGGSMAKSLKKRTSHSVLGTDIQKSIVEKALKVQAIDAELSFEKLADCDILFLALYPQQTVDYLSQNIERIKKGTIVLDLCGVKEKICQQIEPFVQDRDFCFIGAHPMAGREISGFDASLDSLFINASMVLTPLTGTPQKVIQTVQTLCYQIGFSSTPVATPREHDRLIAFTSQLAHIVSSSYIKSPTASEHIGFSAGSFKDLTRVAKLDETMWTELFLDNKESLLFEIKTIIGHLTDYQNAIEMENAEILKKLLKEGSDRKKWIDQVKSV